MKGAVESLLSVSPQEHTVEEAYALCVHLAKSHYENFTVGSWLFPRDKRRHLYAIYAFCRYVDDLGDEFPGGRLEALDAWKRDLLMCYDGTPQHPYMTALQAIRRIGGGGGSIYLSIYSSIDRSICRSIYLCIYPSI